MLIALPNSDKSFTATLFAPYSGPDGFTALSYDGSDEKIQKFFLKYFPDTSTSLLLPTLVREFKTHPVGSLMTSRVNPWYVGRTLLIGDAAHAVLPFLGQGMNAAFEDCYQFYSLLQSQDYQLYKTIQLFSKSRQVSLETLSDLSESHYYDMARHTASPWYLLKKRFEATLRQIFPQGWFIPQYAMIAFTDIPYEQIKEREDNQQAGITILLSVMMMMSVALVSEGGGYLWRQHQQSISSSSSSSTAASSVEMIQNIPKLVQAILSSALHAIKPPGMR
jgi:kynurenine 3-monooxygenase